MPMSARTKTATKKQPSSGHVVLTSHPGNSLSSYEISWGAKDPLDRGPVIATLSDPHERNCIGTHSGSYSVYRALTKAAGQLAHDHVPDLTNTDPAAEIGPFPSWFDPSKIVSLDPWGAKVHQVYKKYLKKKIDIRPSIAITKAHIKMMELDEAMDLGRLPRDGKIVGPKGDIAVTKAAIEPVWYLPGIAKRIGTTEGELRKTLFQDTGGMFPELVTRPDLKALLPPIGNTTVYIFGDASLLGKKDTKVTLRIHDECNGSDVFGSDICTCRPYLVHGIEEAVRSAQAGGIGLIVYFRKEGRALGEVTKFLVYNARKRQTGGDSAATYFERTECVAGVEDMRFQELMPDVLHWLGITKIDHLISMSNMKYNAIVKSGIEVVNRVDIPDNLIPADAQVEMEAKKAAGYFTKKNTKKKANLKKVQGRKLNE